jgi:hypothetical protein
MGFDVDALHFLCEWTCNCGKHIEFPSLYVQIKQIDEIEGQQ